MLNDELQALINRASSAATGALEDSSRPLLQSYADSYAEHALKFPSGDCVGTVTETCKLAANAASVTVCVERVNAHDEDISEHLPILSMLVTEFGLKQIVELGTRTANSTLTPLAAAKSMAGRF